MQTNITTKVILFIILSFALLSCGGNATTPVFNVEDSLKISPGLGDVIKREFKGTIPSDSYVGIEYTLLLYNQLHSGDGVYKLTQKYISATGEKERICITHGKQYTLRGDNTNPDAVVYQLIPFTSSITISSPTSPIINLLYVNGNLELLNKAFERYKMGNYLLVLN